MNSFFSQLSPLHLFYVLMVLEVDSVFIKALERFPQVDIFANG